MIEDFGYFGTKNSRRYLRIRSRIRQLIELDVDRQRPTPHSDQEIASASEKVGAGSISGPMRPGRRLGVDATRVAIAFADRLGEINDDLFQLLASPLGRVAGSIEVRPEVAFAYVAGLVLAFAVESPGGLDAACDLLRHELDRLEQLLDASGETPS